MLQPAEQNFFLAEVSVDIRQQGVIWKECYWAIVGELCLWRHSQTDPLIWALIFGFVTLHTSIDALFQMLHMWRRAASVTSQHILTSSISLILLMLSWQQLVSALFIGNLFVVCNDDSDEDFHAKETQHFMMTEVSNRGLLSKQETTDFVATGTMRGTVGWLRVVKVSGVFLQSWRWFALLMMLSRQS